MAVLLSAQGARLTYGVESRSDRSEPDKSCLLVYDGECRLCVATKGKLEKAGIGEAASSIRFIPYQSAEAKEALGSLHRPGRPDMAFLVHPSGDIGREWMPFFPLAPALPAGRLLLWFIRIPLAKRFLELLYRFIARHRYRWFGQAGINSNLLRYPTFGGHRYYSG